MKIASVSILTILCLLSYAFSQIESGHSVEIKILGVPAEQAEKINSVYPVSAEGKVNMPYVGEISAVGLRAADLAKRIQTAYRDGEIFQNATIQVIANDAEKAVNQRQVHIGGHVKQSGPRPFTKGLTIWQAVQAAGGADEFGAMNRVVLYRDGKQQTINLKKAAGKAVVAMPNDTIEVPQKNIIGH